MLIYKQLHAVPYSLSQSHYNFMIQTSSSAKPLNPSVLCFLSIKHGDGCLNAFGNFLCVVVTPTELTATLGTLRVRDRGEEKGFGWLVNVRKWDKDYLGVEVSICSWQCTHACPSTQKFGRELTGMKLCAAPVLHVGVCLGIIAPLMMVAYLKKLKKNSTLHTSKQIKNKQNMRSMLWNSLGECVRYQKIVSAHILHVWVHVCVCSLSKVCVK